MSNKKALLFAAAVIACIFFITTSFFKNIFKSDDTIISVSENKYSFSILARSPDDRAKRVHQYVGKQFNLRGLSNLELKSYQTRDREMSFDIRSVDGYLKIKMNRFENSPEALEKLKETVEGLKKILTQ